MPLLPGRRSHDKDKGEIKPSGELPSCLPLPLGPAILQPIGAEARDYALLHGAGMRTKDAYAEDSIFVAPFTLLPSTFPRAEFERARDVQTTLNELMFKVANDYEFLKEALETTVKVDPFTGKLWDIYEWIREEGSVQEHSLGLFRSDYMLSQKEATDSVDGAQAKPKICQVEFNTIASSFGCLSSCVSATHRHVLTTLREKEKLANLPENRALEELSAGLVKAWELYGNERAAILFLVEEKTYNIADQRYLQYEIQRINPDIRVIRCTMPEVSARGELELDRSLILDEIEIAVIYFRVGYDPGFYTEERDWDTRLLIERSSAIKCPSINYHLAGTKKVQQVLASRSTLERFYKDPETIDRILSIFTGLYSLDKNADGDANARMAISNPTSYVLKPQREGGGNNVYGHQVKKVLEKLEKSDDRQGYILMDRIFPPSQKNYIIRPSKLGLPEHPVDVVSELGIYGVLIGTPTEIIENRQAGHVLRTKLVSADEGGVAAGVGALDSPYLMDV